MNGLLRAAADGPLAGILGYEERPLVSVDYKDDPRSGIVDALSTMVTDGTQVKILAWYDNEWGYANRLVELARARSADASADADERRPPTQRADGDLRNYALVTARVLGGHDRRRRDPPARPLLLLRARLHAVPARVAVFAFYEIFGIVTNLVGGFLAARFGLKTTLVMGLATQVVRAADARAGARRLARRARTSWRRRRSRASPRT